MHQTSTFHLSYFLVCIFQIERDVDKSNRNLILIKIYPIRHIPCKVCDLHRNHRENIFLYSNLRSLSVTRLKRYLYLIFS